MSQRMQTASLARSTGEHRFEVADSPITFAHIMRLGTRKPACFLLRSHLRPEEDEKEEEKEEEEVRPPLGEASTRGGRGGGGEGGGG